MVLKKNLLIVLSPLARFVCDRVPPGPKVILMTSLLRLQTLELAPSDGGDMLYPWFPTDVAVMVCKSVPDIAREIAHPLLKP